MKKHLSLLLCVLMLAGTMSALADDNLDFRYAQKVGMFSDGLAVFQSQNGLCGYVDGTGEIVIAPQFEMAAPFCGGMALVRNGIYYGFIDATGALVIDYQYNYALDFSEGLAAVQLADRTWRYIDATGAEVINLADYDLGYSLARSFNGGVAEIPCDSGTIYIDKTGAELEPPAAAATSITFEELDAYYPTYQLYNNGVPAGIIDYDNKYGSLEESDFVPVQGAEGLYVIEGKWLFDANTNRILMRYMYYISPVCEEGLICVSNENGCYFVDTTGRMRTPLAEDASDFSCGYAVIELGGEDTDMVRYGAGGGFYPSGYYFIYPDGDVKAGPYDYATPFVDGLTIVKEEGCWYVMDTDFQMLYGR